MAHITWADDEVEEDLSHQLDETVTLMVTDSRESIRHEVLPCPVFEDSPKCALFSCFSASHSLSS